MTHGTYKKAECFSLMAELRRNIAHRRRVAGECVYSPRTVIILFFVFCAVAYGASIGWQIIIESEDVYLETAAAVVTVLLIGGVSTHLFRRIRAYRQGLNGLRQAHPHSPPGENDSPSSVQLRLHIRQFYGESVDGDTLLTRAGGLSTQVIDTLIRSYTYSREGKGGHIKFIDVELGITRANTVSTTSQHITTCCHEAHCESGVDITSDSVECTSLGNPFVPTECSVCLVEYEEGEVLSELPCRHVYHRACITEWLLLLNACPMCKQSLFMLSPVPVPASGPVPAPGHSHGVSASTHDRDLVVNTTSILNCIDGAYSEETRLPDVLPPSSPSMPAPLPAFMSVPLASKQAPLQVVDLEEA